MTFAIVQPPRILFGRGASAQAPALALSLGGSRGVLVRGASPQRAQPIRDALGPTVTEIICDREPTLPMVAAALADARRHQRDWVMAIGGGAVIDMGKALAALIPAPGEPLDYLEVVGRGLPLPSHPLPFIAIPTTAGTGGEVTKNAVIDVTDARRKVSLRDDRMVPRIAIVDPALTDGCPRSVTLASGADALVQVIEPLICTRANPYTDALCRAALPVGVAALRRLMDGEDAAARDQMAWVSLCGGLALANAGLGAVHGLAGVIGGVTGAPHGAICGALLAPVMAANAAAPRMAEVTAALGDPAAFGAWLHDCGLPRLSAMGLRAEDHAAIAAAAQGASSMKANPVPLSDRDLIAILRAAG